jgi:hypothetical protein
MVLAKARLAFALGLVPPKWTIDFSAIEQEILDHIVKKGRSSPRKKSERSLGACSRLCCLQCYLPDPMKLRRQQAERLQNQIRSKLPLFPGPAKALSDYSNFAGKWRRTGMTRFTGVPGIKTRPPPQTRAAAWVAPPTPNFFLASPQSPPNRCCPGRA